MIPTAASTTRLWALQRRRLLRLLWLARLRNAVYGDLVAIFHERRPWALPAATFIGYAELAGHYDGAVAKLRTPQTAATGAPSLQDLLAAAQAPTMTSPPASPSTARSDAHTSKMSAGMGIPHDRVDAAGWDDHWLELARRNGITVDDELLEVTRGR